jgi:hypothetical protein
MELKRPSITSWLNAADHRRHLAERAAAVDAAECRHLEHRQSGFARHHVDVGGVLQRCIGELILRVVEQSLRLVAPVFGFQLGLALLEGFDGRRLNPRELENVIAELGFDRPFDLIDLHAEGGVRERHHPRLALGPSQIAALWRGARILRELLGQFREILARLGALQRPPLGLRRRIVCGFATVKECG